MVLTTARDCKVLALFLPSFGRFCGDHSVLSDCKHQQDPNFLAQRRHYKPDELWWDAPEKKSVIQLPCIAYRTEYNAKYKDHPALQEIVHAGKVQPCCQVK